MHYARIIRLVRIAANRLKAPDVMAVLKVIALRTFPSAAQQLMELAGHTLKLVNPMRPRPFPWKLPPRNQQPLLPSASATSAWMAATVTAPAARPASAAATTPPPPIAIAATPFA